MSENAKKIGITFVVVLAALAFHQLVVAPRIAPKAKPAVKA